MRKYLAPLAWPLGIALLIGLVWHNGVDEVLRPLEKAGASLLWLVPFHALPLLLDAQGWRALLGARAPLPLLWWIATVREAVARLLPVASIGGEVVGIRLAARWLPDASMVTASVIVEVLVTIAVQYAFSALGLVMMLAAASGAHASNALLPLGAALLLSAPLPVIWGLLLRRGGFFDKIERFARQILGPEHRFLAKVNGARLDADIDTLLRRPRALAAAFAWQFAGYVLGTLETWWALRWLGHPVSPGAALAIEASTQAIRHAAFFVPAGLGVQEAAVMMLGQWLGVGSEVALSLALVKRMREVVFGVLALASWQVVEMGSRRGARQPAQSR